MNELQTEDERQRGRPRKWCAPKKFEVTMEEKLLNEMDRRRDARAKHYLRISRSDLVTEALSFYFKVEDNLGQFQRKGRFGSLKLLAMKAIPGAVLRKAWEVGIVDRETVFRWEMSASLGEWDPPETGLHLWLQDELDPETI